MEGIFPEGCKEGIYYSRLSFAPELPIYLKKKKGGREVYNLYAGNLFMLLRSGSNWSVLARVSFFFLFWMQVLCLFFFSHT